MALSIQQQFASIGINATNPSIKLQKTLSKVEINIPEPKVEVEYQEGNIKIDGEISRQVIGLYDAKAFSQKNAKNAHEVILKGIKRRTQEGDMFADIHKNGFIIPQMCKNQMMQGNSQVSIKKVPLPKIIYQSGGVEVNSKNQDVQVDSVQGQVNVNAIMGNVEIYVEKEPSIDIQWTGNIIDLVR